MATASFVPVLLLPSIGMMLLMLLLQLRKPDHILICGGVNLRRWIYSAPTPAYNKGERLGLQFGKPFCNSLMRLALTELRERDKA